MRNAGHTDRQRPLGGRQRPRRAATTTPAAPERLFGRQIPVAGGLDVTFHEPLGVVGVIVPWNFPMPIAGWGFAPALAAGNTVVLKPAELTPLTALRLAELALEAGLPEGVFQVLPGKGSVVGRAVRRPPATSRKIVLHRLDRGRHSGSWPGCAAQVKRVTLELGGKSANIVFADADLEKAAATAPVRASSTTPARTAAPARGSSSQRSVVRPVPGAARAGGRAACGSRTRRRTTPRWAR